jgi:tripartite-type tricarboxylate transporter receptor subunit TctC
MTPAMFGLRFAAALALLLPVIIISTPAVTQQEFPNRPITLIVGFAAGGFADSLARVVGGKLSERLGQNVLIENRGGAGGNIAAAAVAKAAPDGYTLLVTTTGIAFYEILIKNRTFAVADLKPVVIPAWAPETLSVHPSNPARTLPEFIQSAKNKSVSFGSPGAGTASHIAASYFFKSLAKIDAVHVPFQGGAPAVNALAGGHVDAISGAVPGYAGQLKSGAIRGLAISSAQRLPQFPDIPTYAESGFPTFSASTWVGLFAPGKTSDAVVIRLNQTINSALREPDVQERLKAYFMQVNYRGVPETAAYFNDEIDSWRTMIDTIGLSAN